MTFFGKCELCWVSFLGKILGISFVVRYLRNPNPNIVISLLRSFGANIGEGTKFKRSLIIDNAFEDQCSKGDFQNLRIGKNCYIGDLVYFDLSNVINIGDNVIVSAEVAILTHSDCNRSKFLSEMFPRFSLPVTIESNVWLCFRVTVLPGKMIRSNSVIYSNSLVNTEVESKSVYAGIPAKKIRNLD